MTILDALLDPNIGIRVECGYRWIEGHGDEEGQYFTVYEKRPRQKTPRCLVATENQDEACRFLIGEK